MIYTSTLLPRVSTSSARARAQHNLGHVQPVPTSRVLPCLDSKSRVEGSHKLRRGILKGKFLPVKRAVVRAGPASICIDEARRRNKTLAADRTFHAHFSVAESDAHPAMQ